MGAAAHRIVACNLEQGPCQSPGGDGTRIEEGLIPPPPGSNERFDNVSLGDYALYMGEGYIIHGTPFKSLLGRRVTHGCIRVGDDDLEFIFHHVPIGTRVYLY